MHKIRVELEYNAYDIFIGAGALAELPRLLGPLHEPTSIIIVTHPSVDKLYGDALRTALEGFCCKIVTEVLPEGEEWKNLQTVEKLIDRMVDAGLDRKSLLVAFGGGVVGDIAGFAAAIFMRGIRYVQAPTTLLAQVDSSIGGKVGVDHPLGKNLMGAFYQPLLVVADPTVLVSLPEREVRNGMAEVIKYGVIGDESLFTLLERHTRTLPALGRGVLEDVIKRCALIKARIVQQDERETAGLRVILNYGHTIGHAVEAVTGYTRFSHGEAVSIGMTAAARIARKLGMVSEDVETRQRNLLSAAGLPTGLAGIDTKGVVQATLLDKKAVGGKTKFILPLAIGRVVVRDAVPNGIVQEALDELAKT
jgi:3-dehydroquinate synthase